MNEQDQGIEERARALCKAVIPRHLSHVAGMRTDCPYCVKILAALKAEQEIGYAQRSSRR